MQPFPLEIVRLEFEGFLNLKAERFDAQLLPFLQVGVPAKGIPFPLCFQVDRLHQPLSAGLGQRGNLCP